MITTSTRSDFINFLVCLFCALKLYSPLVLEDKTGVLVKYFFKMFSLLSVHFLILSIAEFVALNNPWLLGVAYNLSHVPFFFALGYLIMIPILTRKPQASPFFKNLAFWLVGGGGIVIVIFGLFNLNYPQVNPLTEIIEWNINPWVGVAISALSLLVLAPTMIFFFVGYFASESPKAKSRSLILGIASFVLIATAVIYYNAYTVPLYILGELLSTLGFFLVLLGVYYKGEFSIVKTIELLRSRRS